MLCTYFYLNCFNFCRQEDVSALFVSPTKEIVPDIQESDDDDDQFTDCASAVSWMDGDGDGVSSFGSVLQSAADGNLSDADLSDASDSSLRIDLQKAVENIEEEEKLESIFLDMQVKSPISVLQ